MSRRIDSHQAYFFYHIKGYGEKSYHPRTQWNWNISSVNYLPIRVYSDTGCSARLLYFLRVPEPEISTSRKTLFWLYMEGSPKHTDKSINVI